MKKLLFIIAAATCYSSPLPPISFEDDQKIAFQNSILCKVNGNTISMMDVKKRMDVVFHQNYPDLAESTQARYQFYEMSWRHVLSEMIDNELILSDAEEKEIKVTDGEIREELEQKFGPGVMITLDKIGLTYDEAWKMTKNEMIARRMTWWFIQSKAIQKVTPQDIRLAYKNYIKENPPYKECKYRVISVRGENPEESANKIYKILTDLKVSPDTILEQLKEIDPSVQVSNEYVAKDTELSEVHKTVLSNLQSNEYSQPVIQMSRAEKRMIGRIFYLGQADEHPAPQFQEISTVLQNELQQKAVAEESIAYLQKLRKHYGFDEQKLKQTLPDDLHPFSVE